MLNFWNRLTASDPGLLRLHLAIRGTLGVFLASLATIAMGNVFHEPIATFAGGTVLTMVALFMMREPTASVRLATLLTMVATAALQAAATSVLHGHLFPGAVWFLATVFAAVLLQGRHPKMLAVGLMAVVSGYVDLYLQLPPETLPLQVIGLLAGAAAASLVSFVLLPHHPQATLRRAVRAVQRRAALVLRDARARPANTAAWRPRSLARLNEAALAAEDQLTLMAEAGQSMVRLQLFNLELAVARLMAAIDEAAPGERHHLRFRVLEARLRHDRWGTGTTAVRPPEQDVLRRALADLDQAAAALGTAAASVTRDGAAAGPAAAVAPAAIGVAHGVPGDARRRNCNGLRHGAVTRPLVLGGDHRLRRVPWRPLSRGDTIYKGGQRLAGTLAGMVAGLVLAHLLAGHGAAAAVALLLSVFGLYYLFPISYTLAILCVTILLGLLYSMLGIAIAPLLLLRLEETVIGAVAAVVVGTFVLPVRTRDQVNRSGTAVLHSLALAVRASRRRLEGDADARPLEAMRRVDRQIADLRLALLPLTVGRSLLRRDRAERPLPALLGCAYWARMLAAASVEPPGTADRGALMAQAAQIEARIDALARARASGDLPAAVPVTGRPEAVAADRVGSALANLDMAISLLAERLVIGAVNGFALEG